MMKWFVKRYNKGRRCSSIYDDMIVGMEMEEKHDNIVEEVLRRMAENDLFVKPEKYV